MLKFNEELIGKILDDIEEDFMKDIKENNAELNIKPVRHAKLLDRKEISLTESKVGGLPYIPIGEKAPLYRDRYENNEEKTMALFAQINCEDLEGLENFPKKGLIQIYMPGDTEFDVEDENDLKVIYYENIGEHYSEEELKDIYKPFHSFYRKEDAYPFGETIERKIGYALEFSSLYNISEISEEKQKKYLDKVLEKMKLTLNKKEKEDLFYDIDMIFYDYNYNKYLSKNMEIIDEEEWKIDSRTHCGGYPDFYQGYDLREENGTKDKYDIVLFQLGSDLGNNGWRVLIYDNGFVNFFINSEKLKNKDFSDIFVDMQYG